jgi:hypothetical protein
VLRLPYSDEAQAKRGRALAAKPDWPVDLPSSPAFLRAAIRSKDSPSASSQRAFLQPARTTMSAPASTAAMRFRHRDAIKAFAFAFVGQFEMAEAFGGQIEGAVKPSKNNSRYLCSYAEFMERSSHGCSERV